MLNFGSVVYLFDNYSDFFISYVVAAARMGGFIAVAPFLGQTIPQGIIRNGLIIALSLVVFPGVATEYLSIKEEISKFVVFFFLMKEIFIGVFIAMMTGVIFWGIVSAGYLADFQRGSNTADAYSLFNEDSTSYLGVFFLQLYITILFSFGGFLVILDILYNSYIFWPVFAAFPKFSSSIVEVALGVLDDVTEIMVVLFLPAIIVMFSVELALAIYSRFSPQLNVTFVAMPIKSGLMFLIIILMLPDIVNWLEWSISKYQEYYSRAVGVLE